MSFKDVFLNARILFVKSNCPHCREFIKFIGHINMKLPIDKRIEVIDVHNLEEFGIVDDPRILLFRKYYDSYPTLFFDGFKLAESSGWEQLEAFIKTLVYIDFELPEENEYFFDKECRIEKRKILGEKLICE